MAEYLGDYLVDNLVETMVRSLAVEKAGMWGFLRVVLSVGM